MATTNDYTRETIIEERLGAPGAPERTPPLADSRPYADVYGPGLLPWEPRLRWTGVTSGFAVAVGTFLLLAALGLAIGVTALGDPRATTASDAAHLGTGAGMWTAVSLLISFFVAGLVATKVTNRPDGGAVLHGAVVWVVLSGFILWLLSSGISLGLAGLFGALQGVTHTATAATAAVATGGDLTQTLGFNNPEHILAKLNDPRTAATLAAATGMSEQEAQAALADLRSRVEAARDDPARMTEEARAFLAQYSERAKQQALQAAAAVQQGTTIGAWVTFAVLLITLLVSIAGAAAGLPSRARWRTARVREVQI
jgi:hypothetical protein